MNKSNYEYNTGKDAAVRRPLFQFAKGVGYGAMIGAGISTIFRQKKRISHLERENERLETLAHTDHKTGLYNARKLELEFDAVLAAGKDVAVLMLDAKGLRRKNKQKGHSEGDRYLNVISDNLKNMRQTDVPARLGTDNFFMSHNEPFRLGGDEFAVMLVFDKEESTTVIEEMGRGSIPYTIEERTHLAASRLTNEIDNDPYIVESNRGLPREEQFGIYINSAVRQEGESLKDVLERADPKNPAAQLQ